MPHRQVLPELSASETSVVFYLEDRDRNLACNYLGTEHRNDDLGESDIKDVKTGLHIKQHEFLGP